VSRLTPSGPEHLIEGAFRLRRRLSVIPRILHYVWVGDRPLPAKIRVNLETWSETHPDFAIRAWTNDNVAFDNPYLAYCRAHKCWANASNYIRLEKVLAEGGIYLDTDIMLIGSLVPMLRNKCFFGFQVEDEQKDRVNNAVFGAEPGHWFVEACRTRLLKEFDGSEPANFSSPRLVTNLLREHGLQPYDRRGAMIKDIRLYPRPVFYPYSWAEPFSLDAIRRETVAVHFWDKSWHPEKQDDCSSGASNKLASKLNDLEVEHQRLIRDALRLKRPLRLKRKRRARAR
jgi:mannosyltransferase OCH1-like enzyme